MALRVNRFTARRLSPAQLDVWRTVPVAIVGDELNRAQMMQAAIKPLAPRETFPASCVDCGTDMKIPFRLQSPPRCPTCFVTEYT